MESNCSFDEIATITVPETMNELVKMLDLFGRPIYCNRFCHSASYYKCHATFIFQRFSLHVF